MDASATPGIASPPGRRPLSRREQERPRGTKATARRGLLRSPRRPPSPRESPAPAYSTGAASDGASAALHGVLLQRPLVSRAQR